MLNGKNRSEGGSTSKSRRSTSQAARSVSRYEVPKAISVSALAANVIFPPLGAHVRAWPLLPGARLREPPLHTAHVSRAETARLHVTIARRDTGLERFADGSNLHRIRHVCLRAATSQGLNGSRSPRRRVANRLRD